MFTDRWEKIISERNDFDIVSDIRWSRRAQSAPISSNHRSRLLVGTTMVNLTTWVPLFLAPRPLKPAVETLTGQQGSITQVGLVVVFDIEIHSHELSVKRGLAYSNTTLLRSSPAILYQRRALTRFSSGFGHIPIMRQPLPTQCPSPQTTRWLVLLPIERCGIPC